MCDKTPLNRVITGKRETEGGTRTGRAFDLDNEISLFLLGGADHHLAVQKLHFDLSAKGFAHFGKLLLLLIVRGPGEIPHEEYSLKDGFLCSANILKGD